MYAILARNKYMAHPKTISLDKTMSKTIKAVLSLIPANSSVREAHNFTYSTLGMSS